MNRSKLSSKVLLLATGIGLSTAAFAGSQPAAAQDTFPAYNVALGACPAGTVYDPTYGCTTAGADDFGYITTIPAGLYFMAGTATASATSASALMGPSPITAWVSAA